MKQNGPANFAKNQAYLSCFLKSLSADHLIIKKKCCTTANFKVSAAVIRKKFKLCYS